MSEIEIKNYRTQKTIRKKIPYKHNKKKFHYKKVTEHHHKKFYVLTENGKVFGKYKYSRDSAKKFTTIADLMKLSYKLKLEKKIKTETSEYGKRIIRYKGKDRKIHSKEKVRYKLMIKGKNTGLVKTFGKRIPSGLNDYMVQLHVFWKAETTKGRIIQGWGYSNIMVIHDKKDFNKKKQALIHSTWGQFCSENSIRYDEFESAIMLNTKIAIYR